MAARLHADLAAARATFLAAGIPAVEAALDAEVLARETLGWDRARLIAALHDAAPPGFAAAYAALVERRARREPVAYILGRREFWGLDFEVSPAVLVPRPETELIVEEALSRVPAAHPVADVGTGSGCLAVSLARVLGESCMVVATDWSAPALDLARRNAARHGVAARVRFVQADLLAGVDGPFDLIVSNPPYVPAAQIAGLQPEVREYEPLTALDGGPDGLDVIRRLLPEAASRLRPGAWLLLEFGDGQEADVQELVAAERALVLVVVRSDLQGIPRTAVIQRPG